MTKTEVRLAYQKETGLGLTTINTIVSGVDFFVEHECSCPECGEKFAENVTVSTNGDLMDYVKWLEEKTQLLLKLQGINGFKIEPLIPASNIK